jgi:ankyrin repeat protein
LLDYGANPNAAARTTEMEGEQEENEANAVTPLHYAARLGYIDVCEVLVAGGASPSWMQKDNEYAAYLTPFQLVVRTGPLASVRFFVEECGEDLEQKTFGDRSLYELSLEESEPRAYLLALQTDRALMEGLEYARHSSSGGRRHSGTVEPL